MAFGTTARRLSVVGASVAIAALALTGCSSGNADAPASSASGGSGSADLGTLNVQLSWIKNEEFAGEFFADSKGYYTDAGFSAVNLISGPSSGVAELLQGTADVALSDAVSVASAISQNQAPVKIIGATYQKNPFAITSLASGANMSKPADLKGKKIGVQDSNRALFDAFLAANGMSESDVNVVTVQYDPSVLTQGQVDGYMSYLTNEVITIEAEGMKTTNIAFADNGLPFVAETFTATDETIKNRPEVLKAFLTAEIKGWADEIADPKAGAALAYNTYGKDQNLIPANSEAGSAAQIPLVVTADTQANGLFTITPQLQSETLKSLAGAGLNLQTSDLFDLSLLDQVYQENPSLKALGATPAATPAS